jgi:hypothetical protein
VGRGITEKGDDLAPEALADRGPVAGQGLGGASAERVDDGAQILGVGRQISALGRRQFRGEHRDVTTLRRARSNVDRRRLLRFRR